ncbi:carboxylesterase family protein, partial [Mycolicibacterium conceptionense]|uniref:carboxylesterase family protein n=1 Tax=Mycolicibacterium conceptionense TaxID=451644 RepID=UPI0013F4C139
DTRTFLGIPYAAPPVVGGRFAAPRVNEPWRAVRAATTPGPPAPPPPGVQNTPEPTPSPVYVPAPGEVPAQPGGQP